MTNGSWTDEGRRSSRRRRSPEDEYDAEIVYAAQTLMLLSNSGRETASIKIHSPPRRQNLPITGNGPTSSSSVSSGVAEAASSDIPDKKHKNYACNKCPMVFQSPQALGGHQTCHRRKGGGASAADPSSGSRRFECTECGESFSSGQALGGHKRKHYGKSAAGVRVLDDGASAHATANVSRDLPSS